MIGLGTLIDVTLILLGGFAGLAFGRFISGRIQDTLLKATRWPSSSSASPAP